MTLLYEYTDTVFLILLGLGLFISLFRAVIGPSTADRILSVNMTGTLTIMIIAVLTLSLKEDYLADIGLIYAMLSFLAVVLLARIFISHNRNRSTDTKTGASDK